MVIEKINRLKIYFLGLKNKITHKEKKLLKIRPNCKFEIQTDRSRPEPSFSLLWSSCPLEVAATKAARTTPSSKILNSSEELSQLEHKRVERE